MLIKASNSELSTSTGKILLKDISFEISHGELIHVVGPNGIGKSSLFKAIFNLDGLKISNLERAKFEHFFLPQMENKEFLLPLRLGELSTGVGLVPTKKKQLEWNKASGGERKKALIDRALSHSCDIYVLDEPFNHLDRNSIEKVNLKIEELIKANKTVILISHNPPQIDHTIMDVAKWS